MGKIGLEFKACLENVKSLRCCGKDFRWFLKLRCNNCGEVTANWQYVTEDMSADLKGGRGQANMVEKCKMCSRENSISILEDRVQPYTFEDDLKSKVIVVFDCRGLEPVDFDLRSGWEVESNSSTKTFSDVDLKDKDWFDYDDIGSETIGITELTFKFVKLKK
uniref:CXXC motif containing zinc binding protein-like n=1 Tax=Styela clava TaxID=7725 RepID=UPI0019392F41|nr:CXXC motif containing zinc binding protein-like [Styela clava]